ncbi:MAG: protein kinase [Gemmatimonadetes bacterium]|nr:protein kinase [Gemmatimonadota bacterium]
MDRDPLERIAESISDGLPFAEGEADTATGELGDSLVKNLMALSRIRQAGRQDTGDGREEILRWGPCLRLERLGGGAFGSVWRAWDESLHRQVALKLLHEDDGGRLLEEGRLLAKVSHPGVARVLAAEVRGDRAGLLMELIEGPTLAERRSAEPDLPVGEAARIGAELADALAAVHAVGVAHGDVKPQNVVLAKQDRPVLVDFGAGGYGGSTPGGRITGTPAYLAPERVGGGLPTPAADVYALGVMLGELLPTPPAPLVPLLTRAVADDPSARPSAAALSAALREIATPGHPAPMSAPVRPNRRPPFAAILTTGVMLAAAVVAFLQVTHTEPLAVRATLLRGDGPFERLDSGEPVRAGDLLQLELELDSRAWVYVLNQDDLGSHALLFPLPGYEQQNPLPPGRVVLPGTPTGGDRPVAWTLGAAGSETFLVVATREPLRDFERELARLPPPEQSSAGVRARVLNPETLATVYRGVTGVAGVAAAPPAPEDSGSPVFTLARTLGQPDDVRVLEFVLPHADANGDAAPTP